MPNNHMRSSSSTVKPVTTLVLRHLMCMLWRKSVVNAKMPPVSLMDPSGRARSLSSQELNGTELLGNRWIALCCGLPEQNESICSAFNNLVCLGGGPSYVTGELC